MRVPQRTIGGEMNIAPMALNPNAASVAWMAYAGRETLEKTQAQRRDQLLERAIQGSRFYQNHLDRLLQQGAAFTDLPPVTKPELMANFSNWVTDPAITLDSVLAHVGDVEKIAQPYLDRYLVWESSGSSGIPGIFIQDATSIQVYDALEGLRITPAESFQRLCNPLWIGQRIAFVGAINGHFASNVTFERLRCNLPFLQQSMRSFSILQPLGALVAELQDFSPTIIATYPSTALQLACLAERNDLDIQPIEIWTGGERLSDAARQKIKQVFHCRVRASYGASEFLPIARECEAGRMHVNADWVLLEPVDRQYRPVAEGELSDTVLLTNLVNTVQPLIRYDLQDSVRMSYKKCDCGSHLPTIEVVGRRDDLLKLQDHQGKTLLLSPMAITTVLEEEAGVFDFQLIHKSGQRFSLYLGCGEDHSSGAMARCRSVLLAYFGGQGVTGVELDIKPLSVHCIERSGKTKRVVCA